MNLKNYSFESTPTESSAGGPLLYISNCLSYKPHFDPNDPRDYEMLGWCPVGQSYLMGRRCLFSLGWQPF